MPTAPRATAAFLFPLVEATAAAGASNGKINPAAVKRPTILVFILYLLIDDGMDLVCFAAPNQASPDVRTPLRCDRANNTVGKTRSSEDKDAWGATWFPAIWSDFLRLRR